MASCALHVTVIAFPLLVGGCCISQVPYTNPGIQPEEAIVLQKSYYWKPGISPTSFSDSEIQKLFVQSLDSTLDGGEAEMHTSQLIWVLAAVGDKHFADLLAKQPRNVQRATVQDISSVWTYDKLRYPLTEKLLI